ncbi:hypothetical protein [Cellulomonas hominis]
MRRPCAVRATQLDGALGLVGTVAIAPHTRASRDDEFAALCAAVLGRVGDHDRAATLVDLLAPWAADSR